MLGKFVEALPERTLARRGGVTTPGRVIGHSEIILLDGVARGLSGAPGQREQLQLGHREVLLVIGHQYQIVGHRHSGDGHVGVRERLALLPPVAKEITSKPGNLPADRVEFEAPQKLFGLGLLAGAHAHVQFGHVDGATGQKDVLLGELDEKFGATVPVIQGVDQDARIEQVGHLPSRRRSSSLNRRSSRERICRTQAAAP